MGDVIEFPQPPRPSDEDLRLPPRRPPAKQARIDSGERWNQGTRWGDIRGQQLASVLQRAERGDIRDWSDLCDFMLEDDLIGSLHQTRVLRVTQSDWIIAPCKYGDQSLARKAADLVNELVGLIENWADAQKKLLHAIAAGFAAGQMIWEYDRDKRRYWVREIEWVHNHRFAYDEQWELRLYDRGQVTSRASVYGRALDPALWITHTHQPNAGYPGRAGQLRQCAWLWMFRRWVDKFHIGGVERGGTPTLYAKVPENTTRPTREQIKEDLEQLVSDGAGVVNDNVTIVAEAAAAATKSWEAYTTYKSETERRLTINYLGASDLVAPGANGSQAAVNTRTGATADPRMVDDGDALSSTLRRTMFKQMIAWNAHLFGVPADQIPLPEMRRKTADDEVKRDTTDLVGEMKDQAAADGVAAPTIGDEEPGTEPIAAEGDPGAAPKAALTPTGVPVEDVQATALNGAQVKSMQEIVIAAANNELPRESALMLITLAFPSVSPAQADKLLGTIGRGFEPSAPEPTFPPFGGGGGAKEEEKKPAEPKAEESAPKAEDVATTAKAALEGLAKDVPGPKAPARASTRAARSGARPGTSSRSLTPLEQALSSGSGASRRSSRKR